MLGIVSLKSLRRGLGRTAYWSLGVVISAALFALQFKILSIYYLSLVVLVGLFGEWEELGLSFLASGFFSLVVTGMVTASAVAIWVSRMGSGWHDVLLRRLDEWFKPAQALSPSLQVNTNDILLQLPSIIIVLWMVALYLAVLLERRVQPPFARNAIRTGESPFREELNKINIPGVVIWLFIVALLGAFGEFGLSGLQATSINILNVCLMLFFFQGMAVIYRLFAVFRIGAFWQALAMVVIVGQLFLLVSLVGLVDHWVDFRSRLSKRREEMNKELQ